MGWRLTDWLANWPTGQLTDGPERKTCDSSRSPTLSTLLPLYRNLVHPLTLRVSRHPLTAYSQHMGLPWRSVCR